jgi:hypothetical protein
MVNSKGKQWTTSTFFSSLSYIVHGFLFLVSWTTQSSVVELSVVELSIVGGEILLT